MIKLAVDYQTTIQYLSGAKITGTVVTDTLYVQSVRLDFSTGAIYATIARGAVVNGVFAQNYPSVDITVNPDGSFLSSDGTWVGSLGAQAASLVSQLKTTFDNFILLSGQVQGTVEAE